MGLGSTSIKHTPDAQHPDSCSRLGVRRQTKPGFGRRHQQIPALGRAKLASERACIGAHGEAAQPSPRPYIARTVAREEGGMSFGGNANEQHPNREWPWLRLRLLRRDLVAAKTKRRVKAGYFPVMGAGEARWVASRERRVTRRQERLGAPLPRMRVTGCLPNVES